jgi:HEAT repeat protein
MDKHLLEDIITRLKIEESRWDAILQLKTLNDPEWVPIFIDLLYDDDWVVRWCISEKLGEMSDARAIRPMIRLLGDRDFHVRKNAIKALTRFGPDGVPEIVRYFSHPHPLIRKSILDILLSMGAPIIPILESCINHQNWVNSNRIVDVLRRMGGEDAESALIRVLQNDDVSKNTIMILGGMRSKRAIPSLMTQFKDAKLRRIILYTLYRIGQSDAYPFIVKIAGSKQGSLVALAERIILKIGRPMVEQIVSVMAKGEGDIKKYVEILDKLGPTSVMPKIVALAKKDEGIRVATQALRKKYGA